MSGPARVGGFLVAAMTLAGAGRAAPAPPALGRAPHYGLCAGCHYAEEPWNYREMPADFHRDALRIKERL